MEKKIELKEQINVLGSYRQQLEKIKTDITPLYEKLRKALRIVIIIVILFLVVCFGYLFFIPYPILPERIMIASVGILTFISIYYALIVTPDGRKILDSIENIIKEKENRLKIFAVEKIEKSKDAEGMLKEIAEVNKELKKMSNLKNGIDVEYMLLFVVVCLFLAILFNITNILILNYFGYIFFAFGISYSGAIVVEWRLLRVIFKNINK